MKLAAFETRSVRMDSVLVMTFQAPEPDVERIMESVIRITPLSIGRYDQNAFQSAPGTERYRPLQGAAAGAEREVRKRPGVVEVSFQLSHDEELLERVIEAILQVHSYEEPVIMLREALVSRSKGLDDKSNPHRWWNATGDWKTKALSSNE